MANICWNYIAFFGEADKIAKIKNDIDNESLYEDLNWVDDFSLIEYEGSLTITCGTKWAPPFTWIESISIQYGVTIECEYDEGGADICGKFGYRDGNLEFNLEFPYLQGKYNLMDWTDFVECEVLWRLDDADPFDEFIAPFKEFCSDGEIAELEELFFEKS